MQHWNKPILIRQAKALTLNIFAVVLTGKKADKAKLIRIKATLMRCFLRGSEKINTTAVCA